LKSKTVIIARKLLNIMRLQRNRVRLTGQ